MHKGNYLLLYSIALRTFLLSPLEVQSDVTVSTDKLRSERENVVSVSVFHRTFNQSC